MAKDTKPATPEAGAGRRRQGQGRQAQAPARSLARARRRRLRLQDDEQEAPGGSRQGRPDDHGGRARPWRRPRSRSTCGTGTTSSSPPPSRWRRARSTPPSAANQPIVLDILNSQAEVTTEAQLLMPGRRGDVEGEHNPGPRPGLARPGRERLLRAVRHAVDRHAGSAAPAWHLGLAAQCSQVGPSCRSEGK